MGKVEPAAAAAADAGGVTGGVLVHCSEGKSRSVTLVLAFLMQSQGWTLKQALEHVKWVSFTGFLELMA